MTCLVWAYLTSYSVFIADLIQLPINWVQGILIWKQSWDFLIINHLSANPTIWDIQPLIESMIASQYFPLVVIVVNLKAIIQGKTFEFFITSHRKHYNEYNIGNTILNQYSYLSSKNIRNKLELWIVRRTQLLNNNIKSHFKQDKKTVCKYSKNF